ncbi:MAG: ABC transporter ATP-binding protein, partial [Chitinivibrionales bacterium]|nr:ABC transporter ATP-binding protein [Chitinivibrionales bacterium]MBD3397022.1 ABC transporter ATP-binding protein [Chitinivibrionales bacterium]
PELTGRENIFLNGAILGMSRTEITDKFEEIVEFADVGLFIDTPVKRYSSGMRVRLAFAVAAHLEPEVLLVDEVLAVGDAAFQRKCIGKMSEVAGHGRTVLFVSHQLGMIRTLCDRAVLLDSGRIVMDGDSEDVIERYLASADQGAAQHAAVKYVPDVTKWAAFRSLAIRDERGNPAAQFDVFDQIRFSAEFVLHKPIEGACISISVERNGLVLFRSFDTDASPERIAFRPAGEYRASVTFPSPLKAGLFTVSAMIGIPNVETIDRKTNALVFSVEERSFDASLRSYAGRRSGVMAAHLMWDVTHKRSGTS